MKRKIIIPTENKNYISDLVRKLNNRKFMEEINEEIEIEFIRDFNEFYEGRDDKGNLIKCVRPLTELILSYSDKIFNENLQVIGEIVVTDKEENIVVDYSGGEFDLENFRNSDCKCEHCNANRRRKYLYIIKNGNKFIKVGKSCLKDYLKLENISSYVQLIKGINAIQVDSKIIKNEKKMVAIELEQALEYVREYINTNGYLSSREAYNLGVPMECTKEKIKLDLKNNNDTIKKLLHNEFEVEEGLKQDIELVKNYLVTQETEYSVKLYNVLNNKYINLKADLGIVSSFFATLEFVKKKIQKEKEAENLEWLGEPKDKIELKVRLKDYKVYDGYVYGSFVRYYYFKDENGNNIKWKTSKDLELDEGQELVIKGTIKELDWYKGEKITVLTRCKIIV